MTRHPRARFAKPVNMAVFFFGQSDPPEETSQLPPQVPDDPQQLVSQINSDGISFKKDVKLSQEARQAIARLHKNLGHPHASDLKKMLAMNGVKNQQLYDAVDALEYDSCLRTRGSNKTRSSCDQANLRMPCRLTFSTSETSGHPTTCSWVYH